MTVCKVFLIISSTDQNAYSTCAGSESEKSNEKIRKGKMSFANTYAIKNKNNKTPK